MHSLLRPVAFPFTLNHDVKISALPRDYVPFALVDILRQLQGTSALGDNLPSAKKSLCYVACEGSQLEALAKTLKFIDPDLPVLIFPAWDCLPYDRVSPSAAVMASRLATLRKMILLHKREQAFILLTSANALIQKIVAPQYLGRCFFALEQGKKIDRDELLAYLEQTGYERVNIVREIGEYAVRGGLIDLFPPRSSNPYRLDFFGEQLESLRSFSPQSQKTKAENQRLVLTAMSEVRLDKPIINHFRKSYREEIARPLAGDLLYESISLAKSFAGMEHWLALFYPKLTSLFDYNFGSIIYGHLAKDALRDRAALIADYYKARTTLDDNDDLANPYPALAPHRLYLSLSDIDAYNKACYRHIEFNEFNEAIATGNASPVAPDEQKPTSPVPESRHIAKFTLDMAPAHNFIAERQSEEGKLFAHVVEYIRSQRRDKKRVLISAWSEGSLERLLHILQEYGLGDVAKITQFAPFAKGDTLPIVAAIVPLEHGFIAQDALILTEQDILGERLAPARRKAKKAIDIIANDISLEIGDLVVHIDHGIGRFAGLKTLGVLGNQHDCLELHYAGQDKLYLPVENIELLTRYSSAQEGAVLDKLGGAAWQARKAKLKKRLLDLADHFIKIAAKRELCTAPIMSVPAGIYEEFTARFPHEETPDQLEAIAAIIKDLGSGKVMDRLLCGDVGFGKTEIALRAAFLAAFNGYQTAVVVPTTLLARQHYQNFKERFAGFPVKIAHFSRLVSLKERKIIEKQLQDGEIDIVIGTHGLLKEELSFKKLGLLIIDEEQHFGVKHKERLKEIRQNIHVLTLSATPIPRTLQLALTGIRELSIIASPPLDRLAVRSFIAPFDPLTIRESLLREYYRGGQSFYVCPRVSDLAYISRFLAQKLPELKVAIAHGQLSPKNLDEVMNDFYDKKYHVLLSTSIVESGLDIPSANSLIVHRADMFGLSALYQLRGRIGRSKQRGYALFTVDGRKKLTDLAEKRLKILQSLDSLGMGFQLASHDMDLRGAGNLLGEEQSGHIKEVGFALYQQMLEEAVAEMRNEDYEQDHSWSPQINMGVSAFIPESYIGDLALRLSLYRRLAMLENDQEIEGFAAELIDRFGQFPKEVGDLLKVVNIKHLCKELNIAKLEAGDKGMVIAFRNNHFAKGPALFHLTSNKPDMAKIRPDNSVFFPHDWRNSALRWGAVKQDLELLKNL